MDSRDAEIRPSYYKVKVKVKAQGVTMDAELECFDLIAALKLNFWAGNALKYLFRAGKKETSVDGDLRKASTYCLEAARREDEDLPF